MWAVARYNQVLQPRNGARLEKKYELHLGS